MKRLLVLVLWLIPFAYAADPVAVIESAAPFEGAIEGISDITTISHLPGYGLNVNARWIGDYEATTVVEQLEGVVRGLSGLVRGLDDGDFVSVAWTGNEFVGESITIVVRMIPGDPSTLETYVDGELSAAQ